MAIRVKDGVLFSKIAPAGFEIISALALASEALACDLTITSACDGEHSGPDDPHHRGEAYDIRTHDLVDKQKTLQTIKTFLPTSPYSYFAWIEDEGGDNEHIHIQITKGTTSWAELSKA